jgi:hypothetical protein
MLASGCDPSPQRSILEMPHQRPARVVFDEWRSIERHRGDAAAGSAEAALFVAASEVLRDEYQHLIDEAGSQGQPVPPPLPEHDWAVTRPSTDGAPSIELICRRCGESRTFLATARGVKPVTDLGGECVGMAQGQPDP